MDRAKKILRIFSKKNWAISRCWKIYIERKTMEYVYMLIIYVWGLIRTFLVHTNARTRADRCLISLLVTGRAGRRRWPPRAMIDPSSSEEESDEETHQHHQHHHHHEEHHHHQHHGESGAAAAGAATSAGGAVNAQSHHHGHAAMSSSAANWGAANSLDVPAGAQSR